jgi:hypothetical protein
MLCLISVLLCILTLTILLLTVVRHADDWEDAINWFGCSSARTDPLTKVQRTYALVLPVKPRYNDPLGRNFRIVKSRLLVIAKDE